MVLENFGFIVGVYYCFYKFIYNLNALLFIEGSFFYILCSYLIKTLK